MAERAKELPGGAHMACWHALGGPGTAGVQQVCRVHWELLGRCWHAPRVLGAADTDFTQCMLRCIMRAGVHQVLPIKAVSCLTVPAESGLRLHKEQWCSVSWAPGSLLAPL